VRRSQHQMQGSRQAAQAREGGGEEAQPPSAISAGGGRVLAGCFDGYE